MKNKKKTFMLAMDALFLAIILIMTFTPLGFISFGVVSGTIIHIPVLLGAILFGWKRGLTYGIFFGLCSMFKAITMPQSILDPYFINPLVSVLPRALFGLLSGLMFDVIKKLPQKVNIPLLYINMFVMTIIHTILTLGILLIIYFNGVKTDMGETFNGAINFIWAILLANGIFEGLFALLVAPSAYLPLKNFLNRKYKMDIK